MKKIKFVQEKAKRRHRVKNKWRKPKGIHNKVKKSIKGHRKKAKIGYSNPKKKEFTLVKTLSELQNAKGTIIISNKVGTKKKIELLKQALEKKITISNIKNIEEYLKKIEEERKKKKEKKQQKEKKKEKKEIITKKKTEKKSEEEEKKELDKLLTKKE